MAYKLSVYLEDPQELDSLIQVAMLLGYTRVVNSIPVANLSAFIRAIANGEVEVRRRESVREED